MNVVVRVEEHCRCAVVRRQLAEDRGMGAGDLEEADAFDACVFEEFGDCGRRTTHVRRVEAGGADGWDSHETLESPLEFGEQGVDCVDEVLMHHEGRG